MKTNSEKTYSRRSFTRLGALGCATLVGASLGLPLLSGCSSTSSSTSSSSTSELKSVTFFDFNTVISIQADCSTEMLNNLSQRCDYFESIFSRTIETSDIGRINSAGGAPVEVSEETAAIIKKSLTYSKMSNGLFDISIGAITSLWDFDNAIKPSDEDTAEAIKHVNYKKITVDGNTVTLADSAMKLDLGGIAKGYIADDLAFTLIGAGCTSALLNIGGNVRVIGTKPNGEKWAVGIQNPLSNYVDNSGSESDYIAKVDVADTNVITSGIYERYFELDGKTYHHCFNPKTGMPAETDAISATIITTNGTDSDCFATIALLNGCAKGIEFINAQSGVQGMMVDSESNITLSNNCSIETL